MQREPQQFDEPRHISIGSDHNAGLKHLCLTKSELADHLRMSTRQVELLVKEGRLPRPVRLSGHPRWVLDDVREWLRNFPKDAP